MQCSLNCLFFSLRCDYTARRGKATTIRKHHSGFSQRLGLQNCFPDQITAFYSSTSSSKQYFHGSGFGMFRQGAVCCHAASRKNRRDSQRLESMWDLHERGDCKFGPHASKVLRSRCQPTELVSLQQPYLGPWREGEDAKNVVITSLTFSAKALQVTGLAALALIVYYFWGLFMDSINNAGEE